MRLSILALLTAGLLAAPALSAQTIERATGTPFVTTSLESASTYGETMTGMTVAAHFADGVVHSGTWGDLGSGMFGFATARLRLTLPGDKHTGEVGDFAWTLQNLGSAGLTRLVLGGAGGRTVFDVLEDKEHTPNSALGAPFMIAGVVSDDFTDFTPSPYAAQAVATYRNAVALVGAPARGDIFEQLDVSFGRALDANARIQFDLDTDTIGAGSVLQPQGPGGPPTTAPEPATLALMASGLLALGGTRLRRRAATR